MSVVLITGATGFIGSRLCGRLTETGAEVHAISRKPPEQKSARWWNTDLSDLKAVQATIQAIRPTHIYHLAGLVSGSRALDTMLPALQSNFLTAFNVLLATTEAGSGKIILAGSLEEPDADAQVPCSPYAAAKGSASAYARTFHALYQTQTVIARIFMTYGPAQSDRTKLIPYVTTSMLKGVSPKLSSGTRLIDFIYVDDVVDGLLACGQSKSAVGCTVDIGSGKLVSIRDLVQKLRAAVPGAPNPLFGAIPDRPLERVAKANVDHADKLIGWRPTFDLSEGLRRTVEWYRADLRLSPSAQTA